MTSVTPFRVGTHTIENGNSPQDSYGLSSPQSDVFSIESNRSPVGDREWSAPPKRPEAGSPYRGVCRGTTKTDRIFAEVRAVQEIVSNIRNSEGRDAQKIVDRIDLMMRELSKKLGTLEEQDSKVIARFSPIHSSWTPRIERVVNRCTSPDRCFSKEGKIESHKSHVRGVYGYSK